MYWVKHALAETDNFSAMNGDRATDPGYFTLPDTDEAFIARNFDNAFLEKQGDAVKKALVQGSVPKVDNNKFSEFEKVFKSLSSTVRACKSTTRLTGEWNRKKCKFLCD